MVKAKTAIATAAAAAAAAALAVGFAAYVFRGKMLDSAEVGYVSSKHGIRDYDAFLIVAAANEIGIKGRELAAIISFESNATFNPAVTNALGYTGLIQFGNDTAKQLGTTQDALRQMSFEEQMVYVAMYYEKIKSGDFIDVSTKKHVPAGPVSDLKNACMCVFYPLLRNEDESYVFSSAVQKANPGIKTIGDYVRYVERRV